MTNFAHYNEVWQEGYEEGQKDAAPKWIPVSEGLPKGRENVLVTAVFYDRSMEVGMLHLEKGLWTNDYFSYEVKAWMPLPEPYEEEKDGE